MVFCGLIWNFRDSDDFRSYNAFLGVNECFYEFKKHPGPGRKQNSY